MDSLVLVSKAYPRCSFTFEGKQGENKQNFSVTKKDETGKETTILVSYIFFRTNTKEKCAERIEKQFQKAEEDEVKGIENPFDEWKGFKDRAYNWCVMVDEHWVDEDSRFDRIQDGRLDGSSECFMRIYCTRNENYIDTIEWLITYLKSTFLKTDNWYEIRVIKGNTKNRPIFRIQLKSEGEVWEGNLNG